jgi:CubicO group peptidase (beta-lactamase class C family)
VHLGPEPAWIAAEFYTSRVVNGPLPDRLWTGDVRDLADLPRLLESCGVAGLSLAFADPSGVVAEAWGMASADGAPLTPSSVLQAGSVSKAVTAYAAHRLAAEGQLDLDADVNTILRSWKVPRVGSWQPSVSVRGLLAHLAGISSGWGDGSARGEPVPSLLEILQGTPASPPIVVEALPGLGWSYSGGGYQVVAQVICDVTGLRFDEAMTGLVLGPAGMIASTFRQPLPAALEQAAARGHHGRAPVPGGWRNQPDVGATGLWSTPADLVRFARAVNADPSVQMLTGHPVEPRMGSGVFLATGQDGTRWWSHTGSVTGYESLLASTDSFSAAIMTNDSQGRDLITAMLLRTAAIAGAPSPELTNLFAESISRWIDRTSGQASAVGTYALPWGGAVTVTAPMGQHAPELHLTLPGQEPARLLPVAPRRWRVPGIAGVDIAFDSPDTMRISIYGRHIDAPRTD